MNGCPCGSGIPYSQCCETIILGSRTAETAEQLMRARYTAYTVAQVDFLFESTHPDHREGYNHKGTKEWAEQSQWLGLEILSTNNGGPEDTVGEVEFIARFRESGVKREHHELGRFKKDDGRWYFTEGSMVKGRPAVSGKIGRNEPCPCGSGLKYKKCCAG